ncbi:MAG: hypothetical protein KatS3mg131_3931 [Candidatus Tectimicrobiota bacterium]|nr:MAG: hypothetical protein KatS3mg131_3931 [Candidatus Tectomicrobia bacterium]
MGDTIAFAVRANTDRWLAVLFKDFPHHGMLGDFNDAKLLTVEGIADSFVATFPEQRRPGPRRTAGVHT